MGNCNCNTNHGCDCGPSCTCGCQEGKPCTCGCDEGHEHPLSVWQDAFEDAHYELLVEAMKKQLSAKFGKKIDSNAAAVLEYFLSASDIEEAEAKAEEKLYGKLQDLA